MRNSKEKKTEIQKYENRVLYLKKKFPKEETASIREVPHSSPLLVTNGLCNWWWL